MPVYRYEGPGVAHTTRGTRYLKQITYARTESSGSQYIVQYLLQLSELSKTII